MNTMDAVNLNSGGVRKYNTVDGTENSSFELYNSTAGFARKGAGLGDLEIICDPAPLEIGNYVWCDSLQNGIQDACERGISDIVVQLYDRNGALVGQDTTVNGQYYFNQNNVDTTGITVDGSGVATPVTAWSGMSYATQYFVVFGRGQFDTDEFTVGSETYGITSMANAGANDNIDSDVDGSSLTSGSLGSRPDGLPFIDMTTSATGCGDHKYDLGVTCFSCSEINQLITDRTICSGELVDTLAVTTTFGHPDSLAFVYFNTQQTDVNLIYTTGTGIDTIQITAGNDTTRLLDVAGFTNLSNTPDTFYVYAIAQPMPASNTCRPYEEIRIIVNGCDWGDLPDISAGTSTNDYQTSLANKGDGNDEDGLTIFPTLKVVHGGILRLPLDYTNTTGSPVYIEAWIDWNGDGSFADPGEMIFDVTDPNQGLYNVINMNVPADVLTGDFIGLRIRISNEDNMTPYGKIENGEVEDYLIGIECPIQICVPISTTINKK